MEQMENLARALQIHKDRTEAFKKFKEKPYKLTKSFYLELKEMVYKGLADIQEEMQLWREVGETISEIDQSSVPDYILEMLEEMHCSKSETICAVDNLVESLEKQIDNLLDIKNSTDKTVRIVQEKLKSMPKNFLNLIDLNPNGNFDSSILEIDLGDGSLR